MLTVYFDKSDLNKVGVGYEAEVTLDSLPEMTFTGHVTEVNPTLQNVANVGTGRRTGAVRRQLVRKTAGAPVQVSALGPST